MLQFIYFQLLKILNSETEDKWASEERAFIYNISLLSSHYFLRGHIYNQVIVSVNKHIGFPTCQYCLKCILCFSSFNSNNNSEIGILIISLLQIRTLNTERLSNMVKVIQLLSGRFKVQIQSF